MSVSRDPKPESAEIEDGLDNPSKIDTSKQRDVALKLFDNAEDIGEIDPAEEKRIMRKVDFVLVPLFAVSYIFFFVSHIPLMA